MSESLITVIRAKTPVLLCVFVLAGILVAGLWPFHSPKNEVTWLGNSGGLWFGDYGAIFSTGVFPLSVPQPDESCSLEIWLRPRIVNDSNTILAFWTPEAPLRFSLHQSNADLALYSDSWALKRGKRLYVDNAFRQGGSRVITVTSSASGTSVYIDGALVKFHSGVRVPALTGQLVVGTSPVENYSWSGELRRLAIYDRELDATEVKKHFVDWTVERHPEVRAAERVVAFYTFDERRGAIVHNHVRSGIDLYIPKRYMVLHHVALKPPWKEFHPEWSYWEDALINIGGFIPFGLFFNAYFSAGRKLRPAAVTTVLLGAAVSLTIETLQAFLPTRDSGLTDFITNTLGTCIGVGLYRWDTVRALFSFISTVPIQPASARS